MSWRHLPEPTRHELNKRLTFRQWNILVLRLAGASYQDIATILNISIRTVRTHEQRAEQHLIELTGQTITEHRQEAAA